MTTNQSFTVLLDVKQSSTVRNDDCQTVNMAATCLSMTVRLLRLTRFIRHMSVFSIYKLISDHGIKENGDRDTVSGSSGLFSLLTSRRQQ